FNPAGAKLHAHQLPVTDAAAAEIGNAGGGLQRYGVGNAPVDVHVRLRVFGAVPLPALIVPTRVSAVQKTPRRHGVVVGDQARIVVAQARLARAFQKIRHPVGIVALQAVGGHRGIQRAYRVHVELDHVGGAAVGIGVGIHHAEIHRQVVVG